MVDGTVRPHDFFHMKKILLAAIACLCMSAPAAFAANTNASAGVSTVTAEPSWCGFYKAENGNWIRVFSNFVRIVINGSTSEYSYQKSTDPWGNVTLQLYNNSGQNVGIITCTNARSIYYNNTTYTK